MPLSSRCCRSLLTPRIGLLVSLLLGALLGCQTTAPDNHLLRGNHYAEDGLFREAIDSYTDALASNPRDPAVHRNLGLVLVKIRSYRKAIAHLEEALPSYQDSFEVNFFLAEAYRAEEKYADAIFHYQRALKLKGNDSKTLKALAWAYFKIRYYSEALHTVRKLQKLNPDDGQAAIILARTLLKLKRYKEALLALRAARNEASQDNLPYYHSVEGDIFFAVGELSKAAKFYRQALKEQPLLAGALLGIGKCLHHEGKTAEAIAHWERALRLRPTLAEAHYRLGGAYEQSEPSRSLRHYLNFRKQAAADPEFLTMMLEVKKKIVGLKHKHKREQSAKQQG